MPIWLFDVFRRRAGGSGSRASYERIRGGFGGAPTPWTQYSTAIRNAFDEAH